MLRAGLASDLRRPRFRTLYKDLCIMTKIRKPFLTLSLAALVAAPLLLAAGDADAASCRTRKLNGTLLGAASGALIGGAGTHGSTRPIVRGLGGAVVGREVGRNGCGQQRAYRTTRAHPARYHSAAPRREPVRKVYYDQHGNPVAVER
jgi:hypothetical protein